jgi:hypothetical protein
VNFELRKRGDDGGAGEHEDKRCATKSHLSKETLRSSPVRRLRRSNILLLIPPSEPPPSFVIV